MKINGYYDVSGTPEDNSWVGDFEADTLIKFKAKIDPASNQEEKKRIENLLTRIDFNLLNEIILKIAVKSGVSSESFGQIPRERIVVGDSGIMSLHIGQFIAKGRIINLSPSMLAFESRGLGLSIEALTLAAAIHEILHAVAYFEMRGVRANNRKQSQSGYSYKVEDEATRYSKKHFYPLEEGVTEKLAREVTRVYLQKDPGLLDDEERQKLEKFMVDSNNPIYKSEIQLIEELISHIANQTGVSEKTVWHAFVAGKFHGERFENSDFRNDLDEIFFPNFTKALANFEPSSPLAKLLSEHYSVSSIIEVMRLALEKSWLD